ncbi:type II secretion system protein GspM [Marinobacter orientalis]|uniref:Type II secretion system protein M n=1 Tax=Marinobacter orientalis TaxID=1928859 RepID=A0A7Y0REW1_9GAMM|nr:type II secretion system protein M [Marinobacter orientalis]NMT64938.1 type II secretion system protein M [Marinobacter orientalis]TGX48166.1 type II secretion system protein M [Marinobacter orientalis]
MLDRIREQPAVGKLIARYDQLSRRDQQALTVLAIAVLLGILYFAIWTPAVNFHDDALSEREQSAELLVWLEANRDSLERLSGAAGGPGTSTVDTPEDGRALMSLVTRSAGEAGLSLQRFEPSGDNAIRVWLEGAPFTEVASWLEQLNTGHGVQIDQASMDRQNDPGMVSVRLTLTI